MKMRSLLVVTSIAVIAPLALVPLASAAPADVYKPAFGEPHWQAHGNSACAGSTMTATLAPDNSALSVLRSAKFLEVGGKSLRASARCAFDVRFSEALKAPQTVQVFIRGDVFKTAASTIHYGVDFGGRYRYQVEYAVGSVVDGSQSLPTGAYLVNVPAGARGLQVVVSGDAKAADDKNSAMAAIDSFDFSFVERGLVMVAPPAAPSPGASAAAAKP